MMDASTSAEIAHLLIDIRNNLEYQSRLLYSSADQDVKLQQGQPPTRYESTVGQVIPGSPTYADRKAAKRAARGR